MTRAGATAMRLQRGAGAGADLPRRGRKGGGRSKPWYVVCAECLDLPYELADGVMQSGEEPSSCWALSAGCSPLDRREGSSSIAPICLYSALTLAYIERQNASKLRTVLAWPFWRFLTLFLQPRANSKATAAKVNLRARLHRSRRKTDAGPHLARPARKKLPRARRPRPPPTQRSEKRKSGPRERKFSLAREYFLRLHTAGTTH